MNYQTCIDDVYQQVSAQPVKGKVADYIPELKSVSPHKFGVCLCPINGGYFATGDYAEKFSIQSISKVLSLVFAFKLVGGKIWKRVGVEPSGTPFNSLIQLEYERGIPRNPFLNSGAIVVADILYQHLDNPKQQTLQFIRDITGNQNIHFNFKVAESEKGAAERNSALAYYIKSFGNLHNPVDEVLDLYFHLCSIEMNCHELADTFLFCANGGLSPASGKTILNGSQTKRLNAIMQTCGFYDEAGEFAYKVGLPGKSGVGGGIVAVHPGQYVVTVWSPPLNGKGNSARGVDFLEEFTTQTAMSIF